MESWIRFAATTRALRIARRLERRRYARRPTTPIPPKARAAAHAEWSVWSRFGAFLLMLAPAPAAWLLMTANESVGPQLYGELTPSQPGFYSAIA